MAACPKCGAENPVDSRACSSCGAAIGIEQSPDLGENFGKRIGETIGKDALGWWDRTFGIFGPLLAGAFAAVGFLVCILIVGAIEAAADEPGFWDDLGEFLVEYAWLFVPWGFVSAFQNYFNRSYRSTFRWMSPVISAVGFTIFFWALSRVMFFAGVNFEEPNLISQSRTVEDLLPAIFGLVAAIGYGFATLQWHREKTKKV